MVKSEHGYFKCDLCEGKFQVLNSEGDSMDATATLNQLLNHKEKCSEISPYTTDPNATY